MKSTDTLAKEMGKRIVAKRKELGYSQEQLSEKSNVSIHTISSAERGVRCLRADSIIKVAAALKVSADYLLTGLQTDAEYESLICRLKEAPAKQRKDVIKIINAILE